MKNWLPPVSGQIERHADRAAQIRPLVQLVADRVARPAFAVAARIAVLDDEVRDDAVDAEPVEEALARERDEVLDRQRRVEHGQLDLNRAAIGVDEHLRRHRRIRRAARSRTRRAPASSAPAGSARRRRRPLPDRAASAACAARTRTAQSLSASALRSTGVAAAAPYFASAASAAARAPYVASRWPKRYAVRERCGAVGRLQLAEAVGRRRAHDRIVGLEALEQQRRRASGALSLTSAAIADGTTR